jgi:hypothetical protein
MRSSLDFADAGFQRLRCEIGLFLVNHQRRRHANRIFARAQQKQTLSRSADPRSLRGNRRRAPWSFGRVRSRRRSSTLAAHVADDSVPRRPIRHAAHQKFADARAFSMYSVSSKSMVASAAATQTGLPPKVEACAPGFQSIKLARAIVAESGMPEAIPLATHKMSGSMPA